MSWGPVILPALLLFWGALAFPVSIQTDGLRLVLGNFFIVKIFPHLVNIKITRTVIAQGEGFFPVSHVHGLPAQPADEGIIFIVTLDIFSVAFSFFFLIFCVFFLVIFVFIFVLALTSSARRLLWGHVQNLEVFSVKKQIITMILLNFSWNFRGG